MGGEGGGGGVELHVLDDLSHQFSQWRGGRSTECTEGGEIFFLVAEYDRTQTNRMIKNVRVALKLYSGLM